METLIVSPKAHLRIAELMRTKLSERKVSSKILYDDAAVAGQLIKQECDRTGTAYTTVVILAEGGSDADGISLNNMPIAEREVLAITIDVAHIPKSLISNGVIGSIDVIIVLIENVLSGLEPSEALQRARQAHLHPSRTEFQTLFKYAKLSLETASDHVASSDLRSVLSTLKRKADHAWYDADEVAWHEAYDQLNRLLHHGDEMELHTTDSSPNLSMFPPRELVRMLRQQVASTLDELERRVSLAERAGWLDSKDRLSELRTHLEQLTSDIDHITQKHTHPPMHFVPIAMARLSSFKKAMDSAGAGPAQSEDQWKQQHAKLSQSLLVQLHEVEKVAMQQKFEETIKRLKSHASKGNFDEARHVILKMPDSSNDVRKFKQNWLSQIDEAEEQADLKKKIDKAIEDAKSYVAKGAFGMARQVILKLPDSSNDVREFKQDMLNQIDKIAQPAYQKNKVEDAITKAIEDAKSYVTKGAFDEAYLVIRKLPDSSNDVRKLKESLINQIDDAKRKFTTVTEENSALLEELKGIGMDETFLVQIARENNIEITTPVQFNGLLKAVMKQVPTPRERETSAFKSSIIGMRRRLAHFRGGESKSKETAVQDSQHGEVPKSRRGDAFAPPAVMDRVHFSVTSPPLMKPGTSYVVDVWAHLEQQRSQVIERAREEAGRTDIRIKSKGPIKVERGTILTVRLAIQDVAVDPREDTILWEGEIGNATFSVTVKSTAGEGSRPGVASIYVNGFQVARVSFIIQLGTGSVTPERLQAQENRFRAVFVSYASADQDAVLARVQGLRKALPGLDVFFARKDMRSGEKWQGRLTHEIATRDVMYLFWSQAASISKWVDWEWRRGLETRGIDFIDPFPLVPPEVVSPPKELADELHFDDWELAYMRTSSDS